MLNDKYHPSRLMKNALVADRATEGLDPEGDHWLLDPQGYPTDWARNLARQLGMEGARYGEIRDTLVWLVEQIEKLLNEWPLPKTPEDCRPLARLATEPLNDVVDLVTWLWLGPSRWRGASIQGGRIAQLPAKLRDALETSLASALSQMFTRWTENDVRQLHKRRTELIKERDKNRQEKAAAVRRDPAAPRRRPSPQELADLRADRQRDYTPPGWT